MIGSYVGTNDDGATDTDPTGGGVDPDNNMVIVSASAFDGGVAGGIDAGDTPLLNDNSEPLGVAGP